MDINELVEANIHYPAFDTCEFLNIKKQWFKWDAVLAAIAHKMNKSAEDAADDPTVCLCIDAFHDKFEELYELAEENERNYQQTLAFAKGLAINNSK